MTSADPRAGRFTRLAPRNWSLPVKLAAVLAVPIILAMALGVRGVAGQIQIADELGAGDRYVLLQDRVSTLVGQLQRERDQSAVFVAGNRTGDRSVLKSVFGAVDGGLADTESAIGNPATLAGGPETAYRRVKDNLSRLISLRDQVTTFGVDPAGVVARYTGLIEPLLVFESSLDRQLNTPDLAGMATGLTALNSAREQIALQHAVIAVAIARTEMQPADADTVRSTDARLGTAIDQFRAGLDGDQQERFAGWATGQPDAQRQRLKQTALSRVGAKGQLGIAPADWDSAYDGELDEMRTAESGLRDEIKSTSTTTQDEARTAAGKTSVILLLGLLATGAVVYLIGRSMLIPLRVLRKTALDVADRRLPEAVAAMREGKTPDVAVEPVPVTTREEIGQVARAFDAVHGQAVRLAAEQATLQAGVSSMFVNLSRRSQGLVERQLKLIEQLERNEQDSEQLANLFQLDHLATRMRRNSENLLVLAGSDLAKRANQVVPVVDVLRAAVSEIEQYQRVVVQTPPDVQIMGRAASDLVHLVAELLENATSYSAPDTQVVVSSTRTPDGSVLVEIADQGVGMPGEELIAANNRLSGPAEVNVSASRRMGLFVVGRLASRHGIGVRLASSDPGRGATSGVTASVNVPNYLVSGALTSAEALDAVRAARPGSISHAPNTGAFGAITPTAGRNGASRTDSPAAANGAPGSGGLGAAAAGLAGAGAAGLIGSGTSAPNGRPADSPDTPGSTGLPTRKPGAGDSSGLPVRKPGAAVPNGRSADSPDTAGPSGLPARKPGVGESSGLPVRNPGVGESSGLPVRKPGAAAAANGLARPPGDASPAVDAPTTGTDAPAAASSAPAASAPTTGDGPAPVGPGGLPRRAAGRSLAGPLARPETPGAPPPRQGPPLMPPREPAAETGAMAPIRGAGGPQGGVRRGALRTPNALSSLRTPPSTPTPRTSDDQPVPHDQGQPGPPPQGLPPQGPPPQGPRGPREQGPPQGPRGPQDDPRGPHGSPFDGPDDAQRGPQRGPSDGPGGPQGPGRPDDQRRPDQSLSQPPPPGRSGRFPAQPPGDRSLPMRRPLSDSGSMPPVDRSQPVDRSRPLERPVERPVEQSIPPLERPVERSQPFDSQPLGSQPLSSPLTSAQLAADPAAESPIFEEMASAWFRDNWDVRPASPDEARLVKGPEVPAPPLPPEGWGDTDGWSTGEPLLQPFVEVPSSELTPAGLPKRQRGSQLIPGGAHASQAEVPAPVSRPTRTPEQVRGRLASYQQGVRQGRQARHRAAEPANVPNGQELSEEAQ